MATQTTAAEVDFASLRYVSLRLLWDCNLRCVMCDHPHRARSEMPVDIAHRVLDQLTHPVRLTFIGGEPCLWLGRHPDVLARAFAAGHAVHMITNGLLLHRVPQFVDAFRDRIVSVQISADGYGATYERIRRRARWSRLVSAVRLLQARRAAGGNRRAVITMGYLLMRSTLADLPRFVQFCADEGVDAVLLTYAVVYESMVERGTITEDEAVYHWQAETNDAVRRAEEVARRTGVSLLVPTPLGEPGLAGRRWIGPPAENTAPGRSMTPPDAAVPCQKPWKELFVYQDGTIMPCCCGPTLGPALGSIRDDSLHDVWQGATIARIRATMLAGVMPSECRCGINIPTAGKLPEDRHFFTRLQRAPARTDPTR